MSILITADKETHIPAGQVNDERRELVKRIIASSTFAKSHRLASLLTFICDLTLQGRTEEINELQIGAAVFGRKPHYDSSIDGIVRTQASRLRHRLELYFEDEGIAEQTRIIIPRGGYVPHFISHRENQPTFGYLEAATIRSEEVPPSEADGHNNASANFIKQSTFRSFLSSPILLVAAILLVATPLLIWVSHRPGAHASAVASNPLWRQLFMKDQPTLLIFGDSGLVMYQAAVSRNLELAEYLKGNYRDDVLGKPSSTPLTLPDLSTRRYTTVVDLEIIRAFDRIAEQYRSKIDAQYARDARPNDLKQGNSILIGAAEANPWVEIFERNMHFTFADDRVHSIYSVINKAPIGSEPRQWDSAMSDKEHRVFGVVAYVPNLNGAGNTLILEGTGMSGTEAAWDFASDESQLSPFLDRIRRPDHSLPHFEVVLGTTNLRGSAAKSSILAWRTMN